MAHASYLDDRRPSCASKAMNWGKLRCHHSGWQPENSCSAHAAQLARRAPVTSILSCGLCLGPAFGGLRGQCSAILRALWRAACLASYLDRGRVARIASQRFLSFAFLGHHDMSASISSWILNSVLIGRAWMRCRLVEGGAAPPCYCHQGLLV